MPFTKTCNTCRETKRISEFYRQSAKKDGYQNRCKVCANLDVTKRMTASKNRKYVLQYKYGITPAEFDAMLKKQDNKCAICKNPFISSRGTHVDHDHTYGYVRGILCTTCNVGLGSFKDSIELLKQAAIYLEENEV